MVAALLIVIALVLCVTLWYLFILVRRAASLSPRYRRSKKTTFILAAATLLGVAVAVSAALLLDSLLLFLVFLVYVLLVAVVMEFVRLLARLVYRRREAEPPRWASLIFRTSVIPLVISLAFTSYGAYNMTHIHRVDYTVSSAKLDRDYTILFVSDTHYGTVQDPDVLTQTISEMKALEPDMVLLGGDIVDEGTDLSDISRVFNAFASIQPDMGVYYVWGNHDRSEYRHPPKTTESDVLAAMQEAGIILLRDESVQLSSDLTLIGRDDYGHFDAGDHASINDLMNGVDTSRFLVTLEHQPRNALDNARAGVDLQLSGHTHAGQVWPFGAVVALVNDYTYGRYAIDDFTLIVSSGFAGWGLPVRTEEHCEYVVIHLHPSQP